MSIANEKALQVPSFESLLQVMEHLKQAGFRISKSKLYRDRDKGLIRVQKDGSVLESEVRAYAGNCLDRIAGQIEDMSDIQSRKALKDVELREEQILKIRLAREVEQGKYLLRRDFEAELASRAVILDSGLRHMVQMKVGEWVAMVGGKPAMVPDFIQNINRELDSLMNGFATLESFQVVFQKGE